MSWKNNVKDWVKARQREIDRGRTVTEQMRAERKRKRMNKIFDSKPGAVRAIREGLMYKKNPLDVMSDEYSRRKYEREKKYGSKK